MSIADRLDKTYRRLANRHSYWLSLAVVGISGLIIAALVPSDPQNTVEVNLWLLGRWGVPPHLVLIFHELGLALVLAACLGVVIEPYIRQRTTRAVVQAVEGKIMRRAPALMEEYRYLRELDWLRKNLRVNFRFRATEDDNVPRGRPIKVITEFRFELYNYRGRPLRHDVVASAQGARKEKSKVRLVEASGGALVKGSFAWPESIGAYQNDVETTVEDDLTKRVMIENVAVEPSADRPVEFVKKMERYAELDDDTYVSVPDATLAVQVEIEELPTIPLDVDVIFSHRRNKKVMTNEREPPTRWSLDKLFLPGTGAYITWTEREADG